MLRTLYLAFTLLFLSGSFNLLAIPQGDGEPELITSGSYFQGSLVRVECSIKPIERSFRHKTIEGYESTGIKEGTSTNWSGYVSASKLAIPASNSVKTVFGEWIVPALSATIDNTYSSIWVGIDGYSNNTVEQIGTEQDWINGSQQNYAWFEMYPQDSFQITSFPVEIGDHISAAVDYVGGGVFNLIIANNTRGVYTLVPSTNTRSTTALRSSAEWIVEAPSNNFGELNLADFGNAFVFGCLANINNTIGAVNNSHWQHDGLTMVTNSNASKAIPSPLTTTPSDNGSQFLVTWTHE